MRLADITGGWLGRKTRLAVVCSVHIQGCQVWWLDRRGGGVRALTAVRYCELFLVRSPEANGEQLCVRLLACSGGCGWWLLAQRLGLLG